MMVFAFKVVSIYISGDFSFMGALILEEIMKDLLRSHGLNKGRQLYLAGSR